MGGAVTMEVEVRVMPLPDGAMSRGMQVASRSWKREGNGWSPTVSRRSTALLITLILACQTHFGLLTSSTVR